MTAETLTTFSRSVDQFMVYAEVRLKLRPATLRSYRWTLDETVDVLRKVHGHDLDPKTITEEDLELVLLAWRRCSSTTIANRISVWHTYFNWHSRLTKSFDPAAGIERPRKRKPAKRGVSPDEYRRLLDVAESWEDRLILLVLGLTGVRRSEFHQLRWRDIDLDQRLLTVVDGKGGKARQVPLRRELVDFFSDLAGFAPNDYLVSRRHSPETWSYKRLQLLVKRAGLHGPIGNHALRRMFARDYLEANPDQIFSLKLVMGHESIETTHGYTGDAPLKLAQAAMARLDEPRSVDPLVRELAEMRAMELEDADG